MTLEEELHLALLDAYQRAGREIHYWGNYFLRSLKKNGGLEAARRILAKRGNGALTKGFLAAADAGRADLSVEAIILQPRFRRLFTPVELRVALERLRKFPSWKGREPVAVGKLFPEQITVTGRFIEGAAQRITVNAYERDPRARDDCIRKKGTKCSCCGMSFRVRYGKIGDGFIHIHHIKPLAANRAGYRIDTARDLVPVCPNCHAMLHTSNPPLSVAELRAHLTARERAMKVRRNRH